MNIFTIFLISLVIASTTATAQNDVPSKVPFYIINAASAYDIDADLMYAICAAESRCRAKAINHNDGTKAQREQGIVKKAYGLFQVQLDTAVDLGFKPYETIIVVKKRKNSVVLINKVIDHTKDLLKPEVNALYAAKYIHSLYAKYGATHKVISAYNAGHYTKSNRAYVATVFSHYVKLKIDKRF